MGLCQYHFVQKKHSNVESNTAAVDAHPPRLRAVPWGVQASVMTLAVILAVLGTIAIYTNIVRNHKLTFTSSALIDLQPAIQKATSSDSGLHGKVIGDSCFPTVSEIMESPEFSTHRLLHVSPDTRHTVIKWQKQNSGSQYLLEASSQDSYVGREMLISLIQVVENQLMHTHQQTSLEENLLELKDNQKESLEKIRTYIQNHPSELSDESRRKIESAVNRYSKSLGDTPEVYAFLSNVFQERNDNVVYQLSQYAEAMKDGSSRVSVADELSQYAESIKDGRKRDSLSLTLQYAVEDKRMLLMSDVIEAFPPLFPGRESMKQILEENLELLEEGLSWLRNRKTGQFVKVIQEPEINRYPDPAPWYLGGNSIRFFLGIAVVLSILASRFFIWCLFRWRYAHLLVPEAECAASINHEHPATTRNQPDEW